MKLNDLKIGTQLCQSLCIFITTSCCGTALAFSGLDETPYFSILQNPPSVAELPPNHTEIPINGLIAELYYDRLETIAPKVIEATGRVHLTYQDILLWAERATYNEETGLLQAEGNIRMVQGLQQLNCRKAEYNLKSRLGSFWEVNGRTEGELIFKAKRVDKVDERSFRLEYGFVTACQDAVPKWSFSIAKANLDLEQSMRVSHTVFRIKNIPIFYFPWIRLPANRKKRSSGFLLPSTGSSSAKGRSVADSFYFTLGQSADLLVNIEHFTKRGTGYGFAFRAKPNTHSYLNISNYFVNDRLNQGGGNFIADAEVEFGNGFRSVAALNLVTNFAYRQNFSDNFSAATNPSDQSVAFLTKNYSSSGFNFFLSRQETFFPIRSILIRNAPAGSFHVTGHRFASVPIYFYLDASAGALLREDLYIKTPGFVQRYDLNPKISFPLKKWTGLSITPRLGLRQTFYSGRIDSSAGGSLSDHNIYRSSYEIEVDFKGPEIEKSFQLGNQAGTIRHVMEPTLLYRKVSGIENVHRIPLFDEKDIFTNTNELEYGITQRLFLRSEKQHESRAVEILSWRVVQQYYFDPSFGGAVDSSRLFPAASFLRLTSFPVFERMSLRRYSPIVSSLRFTPKAGVYSDFRLDYDPVVQRMRAAGLTGTAAIWKLYSSWTLYATRKMNLNVLPRVEDLRSEEIQFLADKSIQLQSQLGYGNPQRGFSASLTMSYDIQRSTLMNSHSRLFYNWDCCGVALEFLQFDTGFRNETQLRFAFSLKGLGYFGNIRRPERLF